MYVSTLLIWILNIHGAGTEDDLWGCSLCNMASYCEDGGECCDVQDDTYQKWSDGTERHRYSCLFTKFLTDKGSTNYMHPVDVLDGTYLLKAWMISQCPIEERNDTLKQLCESPGISGNFESVVPVSNSVVHFRNKFCANCNGINESINLISWYPELYCDADLPPAKKILSDIIRRKCYLFYRPPGNIPVEECTKLLQVVTDNITAKTCNITFQKSFNSTKLIDRLTCELDPNPKHYFCYVCDEGHNWKRTGNVCFSNTNEIYNPISPPFSAILDIGAVSSAQPDANPQEYCDTALQFYDTKQMMCRELSCSKDRYLLNGQCLMKRTEELDEVCYTFFFFVKLTPDNANNKTNLTEDEMQIQRLPNVLYKFFRELVMKSDPLTKILESVIEDFRVYKKLSVSAGGRNFVEYLIVQLAVNIETFTADFLSYMYMQLHNNISFSSNAIYFRSEFVLYDIVGYYNDENWILHFDPMIDFPSFPNTTDPILEQIPFNNSLYKVGSVDYCYNFFRKLSVCSYIKLELNEFSTKVESGFLIVEDNVTTARFSPWEFEMNKEIHLCASDYKEYLNSQSILYPQQNPIPQGNLLQPTQYLSFFLVCLSILCLLITVVTYLLFPILHSQPGINNIILCIVLFLAQTIYQFGAAQTSLPDWACSLIGAICHFLWLAVMFSMNVCSVEMYLVFRSMKKLPNNLRRWHTIRNVLFIVLSSSLFVLINIIVSLFISSGENIGYGGSICYLSSKTLQLITFALPSAATVICNILLFVFVVFKIKKISTSSANLKQDRNYLGIYARLSTLTGLTWVFGFLHLILRFDALEYVFIILNASQGVFILVAFVVNKRVLSLCLNNEKKLSA